MASSDEGYFALELRRGETRPIPIVHRPKDKTLPPYNITGKPVEMRIQPQGAAEIVYNSAPNISITNGVGGELTLAIPGATVTAYAFEHADYVIMLDGKRLLHGPLDIKGLYE